MAQPPCTRAFALLALPALAPAVAQAQIVHEPIGCMVAGQFPLVEAAIEPSASVARARVYFKSALSAAYSFVEMTLQDGKFVGKLPKPALEASPITYLLRATTAEAGDSETQAIEARVIAFESDCPKALRVAPGVLTGAPAVFEAGYSPKGFAHYIFASRLVNLRLGAPQKASFMLGHVFGCDVTCRNGVMVALEPGVGGGKASIGFASGDGGLYVTSRAAKITFLRTWNPWLADDRASYLGVELTSTLWFRPELVASVGTLRRVRRSGGSRDWIVTAGIGFGM